MTLPLKVKDVEGNPQVLESDVHVVERNVPLLIGKSTLKKWKATQDHEADKIIMKKTGEDETKNEVIEIKTRTTKSGHMVIDLVTFEESSMENHIMLLKCEEG